MREISCFCGIAFCIYFLIDLWVHLIVLWLPLGHLLASFGSPWLPFGSLLVAISSLFVRFGCLLGQLCSSRHPFVRSGILLVHFGNPFGPSWGSNSSQNAAKAAQMVPRGFENHPQTAYHFWEHSEIFFLSFSGSRVGSDFHLGRMLVQISGSFAYVNEVYSSIVPYSRNRLWRSLISICLYFYINISRGALTY